MPLLGGLIPKGYAVMFVDIPGGQANVGSLHNSLLFFSSYNEAYNAAEDYLAYFASIPVPYPQYVWIQPIMDIWVDGVK